jgi:uncharacterized protein (TIGR02647 family)
MKFTPEHLVELNLMLQFDMGSLQTGIKVHNNAAPELLNAVHRLYEKGLCTETDGGYLTDLGIEAAEHAQRLTSILSSKVPH